MNNFASDESSFGDLISRKSLLIIQAQFQQALGQPAEAMRNFLEAALLEERIAGDFRQTAKTEDAAISLFSAASCYKNIGDLVKAVSLAEEALGLTRSEKLADELRAFRTECEQSLLPMRQHTLRGIVRNGAVYPFEQGMLVEGQLVTITAS